MAVEADGLLSADVLIGMVFEMVQNLPILCRGNSIQFSADAMSRAGLIEQAGILSQNEWIGRLHLAHAEANSPHIREQIMILAPVLKGAVGEEEIVRRWQC